jgi:hypothetical protein
MLNTHEKPAYRRLEDYVYLARKDAKAQRKNPWRLNVFARVHFFLAKQERRKEIR